MTHKVSNFQGSENVGKILVVDVYDNHIIMKGRDFITGKFLPIAHYCLNTELVEIEANTFIDPLGIIKP